MESNLSNDLKSYAEYLLDKYIKSPNSTEDSGFYLRLKQFCEEGRIKGILSKNDKVTTKIDILNICGNDLRKVLGVDNDTFEDFQLRRYNPNEYKLQKDVKKYNL